jgi:hypothetical protein
MFPLEPLGLSGGDATSLWNKIVNRGGTDSGSRKTEASKCNQQSSAGTGKKEDGKERRRKTEKWEAR